MLGKVIVGCIVASIATLWILLTTTTPTAAGPLGILVVFIAIYMLALGLLTFLLYGISLVAGRISGISSRKARIQPMTLRKSYYYGSVVALAPVMLIAMQSVNEVGPYQLGLITLFIVIGWVYIAKRTT